MEYAIIHHTVTSQYEHLDAAIDGINSDHKRLHKNKNSLGYYIAYHYIINGYGEYKQTRGLDEIGYHSGNLSVNRNSIGIALLGNFESDTPSQNQYNAAREIIDNVKQKYSINDIKPHNEISNTKCPGKNLDINKIKMKEVDEITKITLKAQIAKNSETWNYVEDRNIKEKLESMNNYIRNNYNL